MADGGDESYNDSEDMDKSTSCENVSEVTGPSFSELVDPVGAQHTKHFDSLGDLDTSLFDPLGSRHSNFIEPLDYPDTSLFDPLDEFDTNLIDPLGSRHSTLFDSLDYPETNLINPLGFRHSTLFDSLDYPDTSLFDPLDELDTNLIDPLGSRHSTLIDPLGSLGASELRHSVDVIDPNISKSIADTDVPVFSHSIGEFEDIGKGNALVQPHSTFNNHSSFNSSTAQLPQKSRGRTSNLSSEIQNFLYQIRVEASYRRTYSALTVVGERINNKYLLFITSTLLTSLPRFLPLEPAIGAAVVGNILAIHHYMSEESDADE